MNKKVFIKQYGAIPGYRIIEELESRGGFNFIALDGRQIGAYYYINVNDIIFATEHIPPEYYNTELLYNKETDSFYEKTECSGCVNDKGCINCKDGDMKETYWGEKAPSAQEAAKSGGTQAGEAKEEDVSSTKITEKNRWQIPVQEIEEVVERGFDAQIPIPEGYEARVEDGKIIVRKKKWQPKEGDTVWFCWFSFETSFCVDFAIYKSGENEWFYFQTKEECQAFCDKLNEAIFPIIEKRRKEV